MIDTVVFDLHGTLIDPPAPQAARVVGRLRGAGIRVAFATNSSTLSARGIVAELARAGVPAREDEAASAGMALALLLREEHAGESAFLAGSPAMRALIDEAGARPVRWTDPGRARIVVAGRARLDQEACSGLPRRAPLLAASRDRLPRAAARGEPTPWETVGRLERLTAGRALVVGKPNPYMLTRLLGLTPGDMRSTLLVGDCAESDGGLGTATGAMTALLCPRAPAGRRARHIAGLPDVLRLVGLDERGAKPPGRSACAPLGTLPGRP